MYRETYNCLSFPLSNTHTEENAKLQSPVRIYQEIKNLLLRQLFPFTQIYKSVTKFFTVKL